MGINDDKEGTQMLNNKLISYLWCSRGTMFQYTGLCIHTLEE